MMNKLYTSIVNACQDKEAREQLIISVVFLGTIFAMVYLAIVVSHL